MKVINDLVVVEASKGFTNPTITGGGDYLQWNVLNGHCIDRLPHKCKIIGLANELNDAAKLECFSLAQFAHYSNTLKGNWELMLREFPHSTETTDLLFLKRI